MPIYEFECKSCGSHFERLQKLSDRDPSHCPECGRKKVQRRMSAPAFRLAGSGWYETDFKKDGDKKHNLAGKDEAPKAETKADAGSEAKPVATPDAKPAARESNAKAKTDARAVPAANPKSGEAG